jgi:hypothetical protein
LRAAAAIDNLDRVGFHRISFPHGSTYRS